MVTAFISDIHGNVAALDAVMEDLKQRGVRQVIVAGDLVGRGPDGTAVVEKIAATGWPTIFGNHEEYLLNFIHRRVPPPWLEIEEWAAARFMASELSDAAAGWIAKLPAAVSVDDAPGVRVVHGSPTSTVEGLGPWTDESTLLRHVGTQTEQTLICGHTHRPMIRQVGDRQVVNIGSVGLPFNEDARAQYALLTSAANGWLAELVQVPYRRELTLHRYVQSGFWEHGGATARMLAMEIIHARPFLVPFLHWCNGEARPPLTDAVDPFLGACGHPDTLAEFASAHDLPV